MSKYIKKDENGFYVFDEIEFSKTLPTGLEYFAVDKETEQIYNLGFNYKEKMEKQIADLEAKLAESEEKCNKQWLEIQAETHQIQMLEQQLAEKEAEIEELKKCGDTDHFYGLLEDKRKENKILMKAIEQANQDEISFAVEQLEKVRHILLGHYNRTIYKCVRDVCRDTDKQIDNQIKQLKEME